MSSKTNWTAVSALAGVAAALVAVISYAVPHSPSPTPAPGPPVTTEPLPTSQPEPTTPSPAAAPPASATPTPLPATVAAPLPAGCEDALTVVNTYYRTAGSTSLSQDAAATQAYQGMMGASTETDGGAVYTVTVALARDFSTMRFILEGMESSDYTTAQARTSEDATTLRNICA